MSSNQSLKYEPEDDDVAIHPLDDYKVENKVPIVSSTSQYFQLDINTIQIGKEIGKGAFSVVYAGNVNRYEDVAIKCQPKDEYNRIPLYVLKEIAILVKLDHCHILSFLGAADHMKAKQVWIVSERSSNGDLLRLLELIRSHEIQHPGWYRLLRILCDIAEGLAYLKAQGYLHRDIKSSNVLLDHQYRAKLCDFGFATAIDGNDEEFNVGTESLSKSKEMDCGRHAYCGTDAYMAPEMYLNEPYDESVDVFSFGIVMMETICCRQANKDKFLLRQPQHCFAIQLDEFRENIPTPKPPDDIITLAKECVALEPQDRPCIEEIVNRLSRIIEPLEHEKITSDQVILKEYIPVDDSMNTGSAPQMDIPDEDENSSEISDESDLSDDLLTLQSIQSSIPPVEKPAYFKGVLLKRCRRGKRNWMEKEFILNGEDLIYRDKKSSVGDGGSNGQSILSLCNCRIWKTMEMPELAFNVIDANWKIKRELRALTKRDMNKWIELINQAIEYANYRCTNSKSQQEAHLAPVHPVSGSVETFDQTDDVYLWLQRLQMEHYTAVFHAKGYSNMDFIRETGIEKEDLNFLGIKNLNDRKALRKASRQLNDEMMARA